MAELEKPLAFTADFPAATRDAWLKLVDGVLKGAPWNGSADTTYDGLRIDPLPQGRTGYNPSVPGPAASRGTF